eukprot:COSAG06_NODE_13161_length_1283_cov_1.609428_2_plen_270_part_01
MRFSQVVEHQHECARTIMGRRVYKAECVWRNMELTLAEACHGFARAMFFLVTICLIVLGTRAPVVVVAKAAKSRSSSNGCNVRELCVCSLLMVIWLPIARANHTLDVARIGSATVTGGNGSHRALQRDANGASNAVPTCTVPADTDGYAFGSTPSLGLPDLNLPDLNLPNLGGLVTVAALGGVSCAEGYIGDAAAACSASTSSGVGTTDTTSMAGLGSGSNKWFGGVLAPNGKIYGIPRNSASVLIIDPTAGTTDTTSMAGLAAATATFD